MRAWIVGTVVLLVAPAAAAQSGPAYGCYIVLYMVGGDFLKTPYTFTTAYDKANDGLQHGPIAQMHMPVVGAAKGQRIAHRRAPWHSALTIARARPTCRHGQRTPFFARRGARRARRSGRRCRAVPARADRKSVV